MHCRVQDGSWVQAPLPKSRATHTSKSQGCMKKASSWTQGRNIGSCYCFPGHGLSRDFAFNPLVFICVRRIPLHAIVMATNSLLLHPWWLRLLCLVLCPNRIFIKGQQRAELVVYLCCRSDDTSRPQLEASEATHAGKQIVIELLVGLGYSSLCIRYLIVVVIVSVVVIIESSSNHHRIIIVIVTIVKCITTIVIFAHITTVILFAVIVLNRSYFWPHQLFFPFI